MKYPSPLQLDIVNFRIEHKLTQVQLAELVRVSDRQVQNWESNFSRMPLGLWELANLKLGVKLR